jgi:hypothetical protein
MVILIWNFHNKGMNDVYKLLLFSLSPQESLIYIWMVNSNWNAGLDLDSRLPGNLHQGQKQHLWIL